MVLFTTASLQFGLEPGVLESVCWVESRYNVNAIHKNDGGEDSLGLCQIKLSTAQWLGFKGTSRDLMRPKNNIYYAAKYLAYQTNRYNNTVRGIVAYNMGNSYQLNSSSYSDKVISKVREYRRNGETFCYANGN